jgi:hypothetical protein
VMVIGFVGVMAWFWTPHPSIQAEFDGTDVELAASKGLGYEYRWDANSDGRFETSWTSAASTAFQYGRDDVRGVAVFLGNVESGIERRIAVTSQWTPLPIESVVPLERLSPQERGFEVRVDGQDLLFRKAFALTRGAGSQEMRLRMGRTGRLGQARVFARPVVEATVEVRNAFGTTRRGSTEIALPFSVEEPSHASLMPPRDEVLR